MVQEVFVPPEGMSITVPLMKLGQPLSVKILQFGSRLLNAR